MRSLFLILLLSACGVGKLVDDTVDLVVDVVKTPEVWTFVGSVAGAAANVVVSEVVQGSDGASYYVTSGDGTLTLWRSSADGKIALVEDPHLSAFRVEASFVYWKSEGVEWKLSLEGGSPERAESAQ